MYTPGPWEINSLGTRILSRNGDQVALASWLNYDQEREQRANARLIAAAPELLEACDRAMQEYMERAWTDPSNPDGPCADLRGAIAKATGG